MSLCLFGLLKPMLGRHTHVCQLVVILTAFSLLGQASADLCDVSANKISGQCETFEKTLEVASKEFKATLEVELSFMGSLNVDLTFGDCKFKAEISKNNEGDDVAIKAKGTTYNNLMKIDGSESGVKLTGRSGNDPAWPCSSLAFQAHEKSYRLLFAWSISQLSPETGPVTFIDPEDDIKPGLPNSAWIGIAILIVLILVGVGIVIFVYCKCKKRGKNIPKAEAKAGELQLDKAQPSEGTLVNPKQSNKKSSKAKPVPTDQCKTVKKQEIVKKVKPMKVPRSIVMQELEKPSQEKTANKEPATIEPIHVDQLEVHAKPAGAKSTGSHGKFKLLNELNRQIQNCGCQKRTGKICDDCRTAVPKTLAKQSSSNSSGSKTTQDKN